MFSERHLSQMSLELAWHRDGCNTAVSRPKVAPPGTIRRFESRLVERINAFLFLLLFFTYRGAIRRLLTAFDTSDFANKFSLAMSESYIRVIHTCTLRNDESSNDIIVPVFIQRKLYTRESNKRIFSYGQWGEIYYNFAAMFSKAAELLCRTHG